MCRLCRGDLEKTSGRSVAAAFACSAGAFLLLIPGNVLPLLRVNVLGIQVQNVIGEGVVGLWLNQWLVLGGATAILVIAIPFVRFGLLSAVLGAVLIGCRGRFLGPMFRWAVWLDPWGMTDVFLLASAIGYYRLVNLSQADISIELGGACFMAAGFLTMLSRAALDRRTVWRAIAPEAEAHGESLTIACTTCDLVQGISREGKPCPRCGARITARKTDAMPRTVALLVAAAVFFLPANLLPMDISTQMGNEVDYTIFTGVRELFDDGLWPLGIIIFCTSIIIPLAKIIAIAWCVMSVWRRSNTHLVAKTTTFRLVAELGRWSKTDPFTIVFFVPLMHFGAFASANAGWGAPAFMMMTLLTMFASSTFDPRLVWDVARPKPA